MKYFFILVLLSSLFSCDEPIKEDVKNCKIPHGGTLSETKPLYELSNFDPRTFKTGDINTTFTAIYEGLTRVDEHTIEIIPSIAKSWTNNDNCTEYEFIIRKGVFFHKNGEKEQEELTAKDVLICFNHISDTINGNNTYPKSKGIIKGVKESFDAKQKGESNVSISGITLKNDSTICFELLYPDCNFPALLSSISFAIYPEFVLNDNNTFKNGIASSTGPFYYGGKDTLAYYFLKNEQYYRKDEHGCRLPYLDSIVQYYYMNLRSFKKRKNLFVSGKSDIILNIGTSNIDSLIKIKKFDQDCYNSRKLAQTTMVTLNVSKPPFNNLNLRKALSHALNKDKIVDSVFQGQDFPANEGVFPNFNSYKESFTDLEYNPAKARTYLNKYKEETGVKNIEVEFLIVNKITSPQRELIYFFEKELGIKTKLVLADDIPAYFDKIFRGNYQMAVVKASPGDATMATRIENYYGGNIHTDDELVMSNISRYKNDKLDNLIDRAREEKDDGKRNEMYFNMEQMIIDEAISIPLFYTEKSCYIRPSVKGYALNILNINDYALIYKYK